MSIELTEIKQGLTKLLAEFFPKASDIEIVTLTGDSSSRQYFRITFTSHKLSRTVIGVFNDNIKENESFFYFTYLFQKNKYLVPDVLIIEKCKRFYLLSDLGDKTLASYLSDCNSEQKKLIFHKIMDTLAGFQKKLSNKIDPKFCYQGEFLDLTTFKHDFTYFEEYFLKKHLEIENDDVLYSELFNQFKVSLLTKLEIIDNEQNKVFCYRDFQLRNIMISDNTYYYLDYQSARMGNKYYDLSSLLFSPSSRLDFSEIKDHVSYFNYKFYSDDSHFEQNFYYVSLIRIIQKIGKYFYHYYESDKKQFILKTEAGLTEAVKISEELKNWNFSDLFKKLNEKFQGKKGDRSNG